MSLKSDRTGEKRDARDVHHKIDRRRIFTDVDILGELPAPRFNDKKYNLYTSGHHLSSQSHSSTRVLVHAYFFGSHKLLVLLHILVGCPRVATDVSYNTFYSCKYISKYKSE
jgi:hypothetical protein